MQVWSVAGAVPALVRLDSVGDDAERSVVG